MIFKTVVSKIVPWDFMVTATDLAIYELDEKTAQLNSLKCIMDYPPMKIN